MLTSNPISRFTRSRFFLVVGALLYLLALHVIFIHILERWWAYQGFVYVTPDDLWVIIRSTLFGVLPALWLPIACNRPSHVFHWILYLLVVVPISMMPFYAPRVNPDTILAFQACVLITHFGLALMAARLPLMRVIRFQLPPTLFWYVTILISFALLGVIGFSYGFRLRSIDLFGVYDTRLEYMDFIGSNGSLVAYALVWLSNVLMPFVLVTGWVRRNWIIVLAAVIAQLFLFSVGEHRTILFSAILLPGMVILLRKGGHRFGLFVVYGIVFTVIMCALLDVMLDRVPPPATSLITRRVIMVPGVLSSFYIDFFSQNPKALLGWSFLRDFVDYPYNVAPPFLIGTIYYNNSAVSANANFWADAYANFGFIGMFVFSSILGLFLWLMDSIAKDKNKRVILPLMSMCAFPLTNSPLFTTLLSHGLLIALLLIWLMPNEGVVDPLVRMYGSPTDKLRAYDSW